MLARPVGAENNLFTASLGLFAMYFVHPSDKSLGYFQMFRWDKGPSAAYSSSAEG